MKNKKWLIGICIAGIAALLFGVTLAAGMWGPDEVELEELAYDRSGKKSVVYIKESGEYVPYLVIESDYGGNVLLLRKNLLPEEMKYNYSQYELEHGENPRDSVLSAPWSASECGSYYPESNVDKFLNTGFLKSFSPDMQEAMVLTTIEVTGKRALYEFDAKSTLWHIDRKAFLLSAIELDQYSAGILGISVAKEGEPLSYFAGKPFSRKRAYKADGTALPYWTRTPRMHATCCRVIAIGSKRGYDTIDPTADRYFGVRPAFCLEKDTMVQKKWGIVMGKKVYVLDL